MWIVCLRSPSPYVPNAFRWGTRDRTARFLPPNSASDVYREFRVDADNVYANEIVRKTTTVEREREQTCAKLLILEALVAPLAITLK